MDHLRECQVQVTELVVGPGEVARKASHPVGMVPAPGTGRGGQLGWRGAQMWKPRFSGKLHTKDLACESAGLCGFSPGVLWVWCGESAKLAPSSPPRCEVFQLLSQESRTEGPERKPMPWAHSPGILCPRVFVGPTSRGGT